MGKLNEIDKLDRELRPFRIFKSWNVNIKTSGDLDYENEFLNLFDLVIVSIQQQLKRDEQKQ